MYAIGHLCDIDAGYAIWSQEDFTRLFWRDADITTPLSSMSNNLLLDADAKDASRVDGDGDRPVAIATVGSREIIEKDEECLRRVFLLEQRRLLEMQEASRLQLQLDSNTANESRQDEKDVVGAADSTAIPLHAPTHQHSLPTDKNNNNKKEKWSKRDFPKIKRKPRKSNSHTLPLPPAPLPNVVSSTSNPLRRTHSEPVKPVPRKVSLDQLLETSTTATVIQPQPLQQSQCKNTPSQSISTPLQPHLTTQQLLSNHLPPLQNIVISSISFPNLRTSEFFAVFFADDAPYSMRDFQMKRGDVDVVYGKWGKVVSGGSSEDDDEWIEGSLKGGGRVKKNWVRERKLEFSTLTKR